MEGCRHQKLVLVEPETDKVRCRRCHLTISRKELQGGVCPECQEVHGERHTDFEPVTPEDAPKAHYRCEICGAVIPVGD